MRPGPRRWDADRRLRDARKPRRGRFRTTGFNVGASLVGSLDNIEEVLTRAGRGHVKSRTDVGGDLRSARLQVKQDAILTAVFVLTHGFILETKCYLK